MILASHFVSELNLGERSRKLADWLVFYNTERSHQALALQSPAPVHQPPRVPNVMDLCRGFYSGQADTTICAPGLEQDVPRIGGFLKGPPPRVEDLRVCRQVIIAAAGSILGELVLWFSASTGSRIFLG